MFLIIDDRIINVDDISLIEPNVDENTISIWYRSEATTVTTVHYEDTTKLVEGLQKLVDALNPKEIPGTIPPEDIEDNEL